MVSAILFGDEKDNLNVHAPLSGDTKNRRVASYNETSWLIGISVHKLFAQIEFSNGTLGPIFSFKKERTFGGKHKSDDRSGYQMTSVDKNAPLVIAFKSPFIAPTIEWGFTPIVGAEVTSIEWTTYDGALSASMSETLSLNNLL